MKWYVRDLETGQVYGPMFEGEADIMQQRMEQAVMFHDRIFEPQFVATEEAEEVLGALKTLSSWTQEDHRDLGGHTDEILLICHQARDALILLSSEKVIEVAIEGGVFNLTGEMPSGVRLVVHDYDIEGGTQTADSDDAMIVDDSGRQCVEYTYTQE